MRQSNGLYSFKQFDETRSIFIHIPKAAGISVSRSLYGNNAGGHNKVSRYSLLFSKKEYTEYFKFTIVRNPWDRLFSAYNFLKQGGLNDWDANWSKKHLEDYKTFEGFVMNWISPKNLYSHTHFIPQLDFIRLLSNRCLPVDFIGFFECLEDDFSIISQRVNPSAQLSHSNKSNDKASLNYQDHYTPEMIEVVRKAYKNDIRVLGYAFDNSSLPQQLKHRAELIYPHNYGA